MKANKSIRFAPTLEEVLNHLCRCVVCLSRVTAIVRGIPDEEASRLGEHVNACIRLELGLTA